MTNKSSLNQVATKNDLTKLATRAELKVVEKSLRQDFLRLEERVERVEGKVNNIEKVKKE